MLDHRHSHLTSRQLDFLAVTSISVLLTASAHLTHSIADAGDEVPSPQVERTDLLGDPLPENARLRLGTLRFRHPNSVRDIALSPDGQTVVTVSRDVLIAWHTGTGSERWRAIPHDHRILVPGTSYGGRFLAFSADSARFYTPGGPNEFIGWQTATGEAEVRPIEGEALPPIRDNSRDPPGTFKAVDITSDGRKLVLGGAQGVVICDRHGRILFTIPNTPDGPVDIRNTNDRLNFGGHYSAAQFSPDGAMIAVVTSDSPEEIRLVDAADGAELRRIQLKSRVVRHAFSPDGRRIVTTERDSSVRLYAVDSTARVWSYEVEIAENAESYTSAVAFSPDSRVIAACAPIGSDYAIYLLDPESGKAVSKLSGHYWKPWGLAFTSDSKMLYSSGWDGPIRRWDLAKRKQLPLPMGTRGTGVIATSSDGKQLAFADDSGTIYLIDPENGTTLRQLDLPGTRFSDLDFSPDSRYLATGGSSASMVHVAVWDLSQGKVVHQWDWPRGRDPHSRVEALRFAPDGSRLAAAVFRQSAAYLWSLQSDQLIAKLDHKSVYGLSFEPNDDTLATAGWDKTVRFWKSDTGELINEVNVVDRLADHGDNRADDLFDLRMYTVSYAPTRGMLATAHLDGMVRIWTSDDMSLLTDFEVKGRFIYGSIDFSADGFWLATGNMGGNAAIWDPLTGEKMWDVGRHQSYIYKVCFGADDRTLLTGGRDGVCYLWEWQLGDDGPKHDANQLWDQLTGQDREAAYWAMLGLSTMPDRAVRLLANNVRPGNVDVDSAVVTTWIEQLDSSDDATRQAAHAALATAGSVACEPLREALNRRISPERRELLRKHLARVESEEIVEKRVVSLLAKLRTPRARLLLSGWASRDPHGALGQWARKLQRLELE